MPRAVVVGRTLYEDPRITLSTAAITLRGYWMPFGSARCIPLDAIASVERRERGQDAPARWPSWGLGRARTWFPLDASRRRRTVAVALWTGARHAIVVTPSNPDRFIDLLVRAGVPRAAPPADAPGGDDEREGP